MTSADLFIDKALRWFGDAEFADTKRSGWDKGQRLAEHVQKEKTLLLLDGLEPLQSGFEHDRGQVKDPALRMLIEELAKKNSGLCVITTREKLIGFDEFSGLVVQKNLEQISVEAGRSLLRIRGIRGTDEQLEQATREFGNHALAVNLLAAYLHDMPGREISHAALIPDLDIPHEDGRHPRRMMEAFAKKLENQPGLNILNMMGLFDRPARGGEIKALRTFETIPRLTDRIRWLSDEQWERTLHDLRSAGLLAPGSHHELHGLDAHPLVREHFGQRLKETNEKSWRQGHSLLYDYLSKSALRLPEKLDEMTPLFAAVAHGCKAARHQEAYTDTYLARIQRGGGINYCMSYLGAVGPDLAVLSVFFDSPWRRPVQTLTPTAQSFIWNAVGFRLQALGRLREARDPIQNALSGALSQEDPSNAARYAANLSELLLLLGKISSAVNCATECVELANKSDEAFMRMVASLRLGNSLHQAGQLQAAEFAFREAEQAQGHFEPEYPSLAGFPGFLYCDLLIDLGDYQNVRRRATQSLEWAKHERATLLEFALIRLSLGCIGMLGAECGEPRDFTQVDEYLHHAVDGLREAGHQDELPRGLLCRSEYYRLRGRRESGNYFTLARRDANEAMTIAKRGEMRLYECDCHLEFARLHLAQGQKAHAHQHFRTAKAMVHEMGYHRRDKSLAEIEAEL